MLTNYFNQVEEIGEKVAPYIFLGSLGATLSGISQKICTDGVLWLGRNVRIGKLNIKFKNLLQYFHLAILSKPKLYKSLELLVPSTTTVHEKILTIFSKIFVTPLVLSAFARGAQYIARQAGEEFKKDPRFTTSAFFKCSAVALATIQLYEMIKGYRTFGNEMIKNIIRNETTQQEFHRSVENRKVENKDQGCFDLQMDDDED